MARIEADGAAVRLEDPPTRATLAAALRCKCSRPGDELRNHGGRRLEHVLVI